MTTKKLHAEPELRIRRLSRIMLALGVLLLVIGLVASVPSLAAWLRPVRDTGSGAVVAAATASPTPQVQATAAPAVQVPATADATLTRPTPTPRPTPQPTDPPTRIVAPAIDLDAPVAPMGWRTVTYKGKSWNDWVVPKNRAGWLISSAPPGHVGNTVVTGHHNIEGKVFRHVVDLEPGDEITLYAGDKAYEYVVTETYLLKEAGMPSSTRRENAQWIAPTDDERLTLVTCWPYEWPGNTHRVIVVARPVRRQ